MTETEQFALVVLVTSGVGLLAVLSSRLGERTKVPPPALFLIGAAIAANVIPGVHAPQPRTVERVVTVALVLVLLDGGLHVGWSRLRTALAPVAVVGVLGTLLTVAAGALFVHGAFGLGWYGAVLLATAVAPTDPAVVFSVLGRREVAGRSGTILEGESGANDPVGIALMASLVSAGGLGGAAFLHVTGTFLLQMGVGIVVGVLGGRLLLLTMRRVALPSEGLYPLRTLASALVLYGVATLAHGSGFLAVFAAGIALGDEKAPYKREIERFHSALASLGEIVAFVVLGLTIDLSELARLDVWLPGLVLGLVLAVVIRPVMVGLCLIPARVRGNETAFVLFAGLKGAVPILLGSYLLTSNVHDPRRLYGIIVVVVVSSVVVQASLVPAVARRLHLPMRTVDPEPWAAGVRLKDEPGGVHRLTVRSGSPADGQRIEDLVGLPGDAWISLVVRDGQLVPVRGGTELEAGDEVLVLAEAELADALSATFERPSGKEK